MTVLDPPALDLDDRREQAAPRAPMKLAVIGLGRFGSTHVRRLAALPDFTLAAAVDPSAEARQATASAGIATFASLDELPAGIGAAVVAASDEAHARVAIALLRRGCHVLVEKPLATDAADARAMIQAAAQHGVKLCTGHIERFNPALDAMRLATLRRLARGHRGECGGFVGFRRFSCRKDEPLASVLDLMVHDLDLLAWICELPPEAPLELLSRHVGPNSVQVRVRVGGLQAELESGFGAAASIAQLHVRAGAEQQQLDLRDPARRWVTGEDALTRQYRAFRRYIEGGASCIATGADGLAAVVRARRVLGD